jgi:CheY-like chemotaxis protein
MDLQMPILDGYQATNNIRALKDKTKANTPIVALSAFSQAEIKEKTKSYNMDGYMTKPFNPSELYSLLMFYSAKNAKRLIV